MMKTLYLTLGPFGAAVADRAACPEDIVRPFPHDAADIAAALDTLFAEADFVAVAAWRPDAGGFMAVEEAARRTGTPWSLAVLTGTHLSVGPLTHPGRPGCYGCHVKRAGTHHRAPGRQSVLEQFYRKHPEAGPEGFTRPMVSLAANALKGDAAAGLHQAGRLRIVDVLTGQVTLTKVLPVHGCPSCFADRAQAQPGARFVRDLAPALSEILR
ncbi:TOMM precursor leader peptide-binding protein [Roseivivax sediminis]|uniref:Bacteriocin biosynthesis cyclodehydratase domain-containing protein n=1 Tax=Roseivivax sediminis TaxID=936889 RepID=A0A1I1WFS7_9RHOB|nr:TOMM precursor leader peptide-binding protein [Roseivivax sediminis]SFD91940.1 bacteriocin biosynthesis cyclodehydratase domain-containing protein [Roseivivax sediminis]